MATKYFKSLKTISLDNPHQSGAEDKSTFDEIVAAYEEIKSKLENDEKVYVGYVKGERAGSIAYISRVDCPMDKIVPKPYLSSATLSGERKWHCYNGFHSIVRWEGRRNKVQCYIGYDMVYLPDYKGPTVWEKFDKKAAEKAALEEKVVNDRDGNELNVGDRVLYINARYGGAARLDRGKIVDIKMKVNKSRWGTSSELNVFIETDDGAKSKITGPELSVLKIEE